MWRNQKGKWKKRNNGESEIGIKFEFHRGNVTSSSSKFKFLELFIHHAEGMGDVHFLYFFIFLFSYKEQLPVPKHGISYTPQIPLQVQLSMPTIIVWYKVCFNKAHLKTTGWIANQHYSNSQRNWTFKLIKEKKVLEREKKWERDSLLHFSILLMIRGSLNP